MKKLLICFIGVCMTTVAWADTIAEEGERVKRAAQRESAAEAVFAAARTGNVAQLRSALLQAEKNVWQHRDGYGNNLFHIAKNKETFTLIWNLLNTAERETLLAQKNNTGEIPMVTHIMYDHEDLFLEYFPRTDLSAQMKATTVGLRSNSRELRVTARIQQEELLVQSNCGGQTMWQRAQALYAGTFADSYGRSYRQSMKAVLELIEKTAPWLKR